MKKIKNIIRLSIIDNNSGKKLGSVKDMIFSNEDFRVLAIVLSEGGLFKDEKIIRFENIFKIGKDFISVNKKNVIEKLEDFPDLEKASEKSNKLINLKVIVEDGVMLGYVNDIIFNENSGKLLGFSITEGVLQDILEGKDAIPYMEGMKITEKALVLNKDFESEYEKNKEKYRELLDL